MGDIPESRDSDHEDVSLALDVAKSRLAQGDHAEAIKWLRKAADTAFDVGDDRRGIELSKAAAELKPGGVTLPPPPMAPGPPVPGPAPGPPVPGPAPGKTAKPSIPPSGLSKPLHKPVVPGGGASPAQPRVPASPPQPPKPTLSRPVPTERKSAPVTSSARPTPGATTPKPAPTAKPPLPKRTVDEEDATRELVMADRFMAEDLARPEPESVEEWPTESAGHVMEAGEFTDRIVRDSPKGGAVAPAFSQAIRVGVARGANGVVMVRPLDEAGLQPGEYDAVLVGLVSDVDLTHLFR